MPVDSVHKNPGLFGILLSFVTRIDAVFDPGEDDLTINDIDLCIYKNTKKHFCDRYDITSKTDPEKKPQIPKLVIRRGFSFEIILRLSRPYKKGKDKVSIQLAFGSRPKIPKKTLVRIPLESSTKSKEWSAHLKTVNANELTVEVTSPTTCFVGIWRLSGHVIYSNNLTKVTKYKEVYILFNPFHKEDEVFMSDATDREEYVMSDIGILFIGTCETYSSRPWSFAQFYGHVLECTMYLLKKSDLPFTDRGRPVQVSRRLAALVNSADDDGVIEGRWDGEYSAGVPPTDWQGSAKILEQYWKTKKTVLYGQCWVFSGLLVTVCRAIGIPCRSVTNYCSAHDTDSSVSVDHFYNENYEYEEHMNEDSIWNFHVWNEVYMKRPDLPEESYGGWQALDSTPQETSDGIFCCGPCPIAAIKKGDVNTKYDAPFIIAEVNADLIMWLKQKNGRYKMAKVAENTIGTRILTKKVNKMEAHEITLEYKFAEGTKEERASITRAMLSGSRAKDMTESKAEDVEVKLLVDKDTALGADFTTKLTLKNTSNETRTINGSISTMSVYYTGVIAHVLIKQPIKYVLKSNASETISGLVRYADYAQKLKDHCNITIRCVLEADETKQLITINRDFRLKKPALSIKAPSSAKIHVMTQISVSFKNPLPVQLTKCYLYVGGSGLTPNITVPQRNVGVGEIFTASVPIWPWSKGIRTLICVFSCTEIRGIVGQHQIKVIKM